jgi:hypothetical protein
MRLILASCLSISTITLMWHIRGNSNPCRLDVGILSSTVGATLCRRQATCTAKTGTETFLEVSPQLLSNLSNSTPFFCGLWIIGCPRQLSVADDGSNGSSNAMLADMRAARQICAGPGSVCSAACPPPGSWLLRQPARGRPPACLVRAAVSPRYEHLSLPGPQDVAGQAGDPAPPRPGLILFCSASPQPHKPPSINTRRPRPRPRPRSQPPAHTMDTASPLRVTMATNTCR